MYTDFNAPSLPKYIKYCKPKDLILDWKQNILWRGLYETFYYFEVFLIAEIIYNVTNIVCLSECVIPSWLCLFLSNFHYLSACTEIYLKG